MQVEVWSDVICPWCYLGRRRFETALSRFEGRQTIEVRYRSFELDPEAPRDSGRTLPEALSEKYGISVRDAQLANDRLTRLAAEEGLGFHLERARPTNTLDAHRLLQLAQLRGIRPALEERFERAYFCEGEYLADLPTLLRLAVEGGLSESDARRVLAGRAFTLQVRSDEQRATALGVDGVPFFLFDGSTRLSGARPVEELLKMLEGPPMSLRGDVTPSG